MTRQHRLLLRAALPYIAGALIEAAVLAIYGFVGHMEYDTLIIINGK
jgi:hypothetical protein